jgi:hypothetical protein
MVFPNATTSPPDGDGPNGSLFEKTNNLDTASSFCLTDQWPIGVIYQATRQG